MSAQNVASLFQNQAHQDAVQPFMALSFDQSMRAESAVFGAQLQGLTPRMMRWSDDVWILDLRLCLSYWESQARQQQEDVLTLWRSLLDELAGTVSDEAGGRPGGSYRAALADHPWQAVLLLESMQQRRLYGMVSGRGPFGHTLFRETSWEAWWQACGRLGHHFAAVKRRAFREDNFRSRCAQMQRAVKRLGLAHPAALQAATPESMKRRFGAVMHDVWRWSYHVPTEPQRDAGPVQGDLFSAGADTSWGRGWSEGENCTAMFACGFPWRSVEFRDQPQVQRALDYPLTEWAQIEPWLKDDLDRLCRLDSWSIGERVVSLEWCLVFRDMTRHNVRVNFRHPHPLHLERGRHPTALLQALYAFQAAIPGSPLDPARRDELLPIEPVVSWELIVRERLTISDHMQQLFRDEEAHSQQLTDLRSLENKLPVPLQSYVMHHDWQPEDGYGVQQASRDGDLVVADEEHLSSPMMMAASRQRPLFLYAKPVRIDKRSGSCRWEFVERTMAKWWHKLGAPWQRDYYRLIDRQQRSYWVFRDTQGHWFAHGVYG